jgi:hypothetical protein
MSTFTGSELEFLAGLNRSWWRLYCGELARLLKRENAIVDSQHKVDAVTARDAVRRPTAQILPFARELRGCGEDRACPLRRLRRNAADAGRRVAAPR